MVFQEKIRYNMSAGLIILLYSIAAYGFCNIVVFGSGPFRIFEHIREWALSISEHFHLLFSCMMCLPANFGLICSLFNWFFVDMPFTPFNIVFEGTNLWWLAMCFDSVFTSGIVWLIHNVESFFENLGEGNDNSDNPVVNNGEVIQVDDITSKHQED